MDAASTAIVGDALTAGGSWQEWLPERRVEVVTIDSGTTEELLAMTGQLVELGPDTVTLQAGGMDLLGRRAVEHVVRNLEYLMVTLRRDLPGVRLLTQSVLPYNSTAVADADDANRHLRQFSHTVGAQFLDLRPTLLGQDGELKQEFVGDREVLNALGYEVWASEFRAALERLESAPPMSRPIPIVTPS